MHYVFVAFALISMVATVEWVYVKARKAVTWTTHPNLWDTFAMIEISHRERKLKRELSADETKVIIEKWFGWFAAARLYRTGKRQP